jgi:hypothetical protein
LIFLNAILCRYCICLGECPYIFGYLFSRIIMSF